MVVPKTPSLYSRMQAHGTLTEKPRDVPDARFALPSTIHWMRALALLTHHLKVDFAAARAFYAKIQPRSMPAPELNTVCEQLLFVLNQIAALQALTSASNKRRGTNGNRRLVLRHLQRCIGDDGGDGRLVSGQPYADREEIAGTLSRQESRDRSIRRLSFKPRRQHGQGGASTNEGERQALSCKQAHDGVGSLGLLHGIGLWNCGLGAIERC